MNPVAASPCEGGRPGDAGVTVPSGPGVSDPAVRRALAAIQESSRRCQELTERLKQIAAELVSDIPQTRTGGGHHVDAHKPTQTLSRLAVSQNRLAASQGRDTGGPVGEIIERMRRTRI